jgi:hypothetical protein
VALHSRWWLHEHTDPSGTVTAVMAFADSDPDENTWPPADPDSRSYELPCWQTGCVEVHWVRPVDRATFERAVAPGPGFAGESRSVHRFAHQLAEQLHARGLLADPEGPDDKIVSRIVAAMDVAFGGEGYGVLPQRLADVVESGSVGSPGRMVAGG